MSDGVKISGCGLGNNRYTDEDGGVKRVQDTSLDYPIIMDRDGFIMDGWHRVVKALVEGRETIKAVRFDETPSPEFYEDRP
jgi:hypothetical protein